MIPEGTFVQIERTLLTPEQRAPQVPEDTGKVPYMLWVNGFLCQDAEIGDSVFVKTLIGRQLSGKMVDALPSYSHDFGKPIKELLTIETQNCGGNDV